MCSWCTIYDKSYAVKIVIIDWQFVRRERYKQGALFGGKELGCPFKNLTISEGSQQFHFFASLRTSLYR